MYLGSLIVINITINQLESNVSLITIYCLRLFLVVYKYICNVLPSEVMVGDTCIPSLVVISSTINNQLMWFKLLETESKI